MSFFETDGRKEASGLQNVLKMLNGGVVRAAPFQSVYGIIGYQINFSVETGDKFYQKSGLFRGVIDALD